MTEKINIPFFFVIIFLFLQVVQLSAQEFYLSQESLKNDNRFWMPYQWKYQAGDNSEWAQPEFDDANWRLVDTRLFSKDFPAEDWKGIGWFRLSLEIDSQLVNNTLAVGIWQAGASELYLDGRLIHQFGTVGMSRETEQAYLERNPQLIIFSKKSYHTLAIRYSNHRMPYFHKHKTQAGFMMWLSDWNKAQTMRVSNLRSNITQKNIFMTIPIIMALVHLLLFLHYPKFRQNLYYTFLLIGFAFLIYFQLQVNLTNSYANILFLNKMFFLAMMFSTLAGALTTYSNSNKIPPQFYVFSAIFTILTFLIFLFPSRVIVISILMVTVVVLADIFRVMLSNPSQDGYSQWIVRIGFSVLFFTVTYQILIVYDILPPVFGIDHPYLVGILAMLFSTSIDLARDFALTSRNLEKQLIQVKELSEKTLAQERLQREQEIQRVLLEKENQRKSLELEEARKLQISMLPEPLETYPGFDISFQMQTATEVGGDYYDYHISSNNYLTLAIGDATGHGMKAGTMVSVIKSLFVAESGEMEPGSFLQKCHQTIRKMRLGNLYMTLLLARSSIMRYCGPASIWRSRKDSR